MKYFCLLTHGRSGSTAFMRALAAHADIVTPDKQTESPDNELLHPKWVDRYRAFYQKYHPRPITNELRLIEAFYRSAGTAGFAGFKSMPNRHRKLQALIQNPKVQVITLVRQDIASTIASFLVATDRGTWRRSGEPQPNRLVYSERLDDRITAHLKYILYCNKVLARIPRAIHIEYESLCQPDFNQAELNHFFKRNVALESARPPVEGSSYVENWPAFRDFIAAQTKQLRGQKRHV